MTGETETHDQPQRVQEREALRQSLPELLQRAQREVALLAPTLNAEIFNQQAISQSLASLIAKHQRNRVRILVDNHQQLLRDNERLAELGRRFSDFIQIHKLAPEHHGRSELLLLIDRQGYLYQADANRFDAIINFSDPIKTVQYHKEFDGLWQASSTLPGLHTLGL